MCETGQRARIAREVLLPCDRQVLVVEGGLKAWKAARLPMVQGSGGVISLERQVRIAVGSMVLLGVALAAVVHPGFIWLAGFFGAGLVFAGVTDSCAMALALARLPWNRVSAGGAALPRPSSASSGSVTSNGAGA
jgi:rhodanese-related sulfurtransferase